MAERSAVTGKPQASTQAAAFSKAHEPLHMDGVINALASVIVVVDADNTVTYVNIAGEQLFHAGASTLVGRPLQDLLPPNTPVVSLVDLARRTNSLAAEHDLTIETPRIGRHILNAQAAPLSDDAETIVLALHLRGIAEMFDRQMTHRGAARSVTSMAAMLAHEVRNPLSGIRGAAQLLEQTAAEEDRALAQLIRDETDRISNLIGRMEVFSDGAQTRYEGVNIHQVLDRVQRLAETGFGRHVRFYASFDPSLPPVLGSHDQLVQVFLNLVKNAAEACPEVGGEIQLKTAYQHGIRFVIPGTRSRVELPLVVSVCDNGVGIPDDIREYLFDPFITSKQNGTGLGLALVAKLIGDHGGVIECESRPGRTEFKIMLPVYKGEKSKT